MAVSSPPTSTAQPRFGLTSTDLTMILVVLIWGANFSVVKIALAEIPPVGFAAVRFTLAGVLLWLFLCWREGPLKLSKSQLWKMTWVGIVGNTLYQVLFSYSLTITSAANGALLISTTPAMVALAGALLGIERMRRTTIAGIGLAFAGVGLVLAARGLGFTNESVRGDLLMIGAAVCWTIYTLGVRTIVGDLSPLRITTMTMITGVPGLLLIGLPDILSTDWLALSGGAWFALCYATLLGLVVAYVLWNSSVRLVGSNRTAIYGCAIPLVAALVAWPALGEIPTWGQAAGAVLIIGGVLLTRK